MDTLLQDLRFAMRDLLRHPGFALIAILTLALGIGASATIFGVANTLLLRPLPYEEPDHLAQIWDSYRGRGGGFSLSYPNVKDTREQSYSFEDIAHYSTDSYSFTGSEWPERLSALRVSANLFPLLGVEPALGRGFTPEEDRPGASKRVVILSQGFWQRRFGGDPGVLGRTLVLSGIPYSIIGVMPASFLSPEPEIEIITPARIDETVWGMRRMGGLQAVGRLSRGVTLEQAQIEMSAIARRLEQEYPEANTGRGVSLVPLKEQFYGEQVRLGISLLLGAVGLLVLIACANMANLLLVRAVAREREIAIRTAVGAGRGRVVRQLLTESIVLALLSGSAGVLIAIWGTNVLASAAPEWLARGGEIGIDGRVLAFTLGLSLLTGLLFGLTPVFQTTRSNLASMLHEGPRGAMVGIRRRRLRGMLVTSEVALSLVLLVAAGLLIRSLIALLGVEPGFAPDHLLSVRLSLGSEYDSPGKVTGFRQQAIERILAVPGVLGAAGVSTLPMTGVNRYTDFHIEGRPVQSAPDNAGEVYATPDYFRTMRVPIRRGRPFGSNDDLDAPAVAVVNQSLARKHWPGEDPIGKRLVLRWEDAEDPSWRSVVGVVGDVHHLGLSQPPRPEIYVPYAQLPWPTRDLVLVVRAASDPASLAPAVQRAILAVDPDQPVYDVRTMEKRVLDSVLAQRALATLLGVFGAAVLLLTAVGIYGVISHTVTQRTYEIGIRAALGASRGRVLRFIIGEGMGIVGVGLLIGLAASLALSRFAAGLLYGVPATDPATLAGAVLLLGAIALVATYVPARRAAKVDAMVALRFE